MDVEDDFAVDINHQYFPNTSGSCSVEQAIAKLLGWSQGPLFKKAIKVTEAGVIDDDLKWVEVFEGGIDAQLESMLVEAQNGAIAALEIGSCEKEPELFSVQSEWVKRIGTVKDQIARVHDIRIRIEDELAKGQASQLRIDSRRSDESGNVYITLMSLDEWALNVYGRPIILRPDGADGVIKQASDQAPATQVDRPEDSTAANALILVSLLQDLLMEVSTQKHIHGDRPNKASIALRLSEMAKDAGIAKFGSEKLRKLLAEADRVRHREVSVKARRS
jgi:hypothetical protein